MHVYRKHRRSTPAVVTVALLALWGCSGTGETELTPAESALVSAARVQVTGSTQPSSVTAGQEIDLLLRLTSQKQVSVDVDMSVTTPSGANGYSASWRSQTITPSAPLVLEEPVLTQTTDAAGTYRVSVTVRRTGGTTVLFNNTSLATFTIASATPMPANEASIWSASTVPTTIASGDTSANELGVRFRSSVAGQITGVRFYKAASNTGTHVGNLWTAAGQKLATVTFTGETASGWQVARFATPVNITANTVYIASYFSPNGNYSAATGYFATTGATNGALYALRDGESGGNGVYNYGSSAFPNSTWNASNYYVDVLFVAAAGSCVPACSGKTCGADGCGGVCGTCGTAQTCSASGQCVSTTPATVCGNGTCESGETCASCASDCCAPTQACASPVWTSSDRFGTHTFPNGYVVHNNVWNDNGGPQTIFACSPSSWYVQTNQPVLSASRGEIKSYPCTQVMFNGRAANSFTTFTSSFAHTAPPRGVWNASYDIWLGPGGWDIELMLWTDYRYLGTLPPGGNESATVTIDGQQYVAWIRPDHRYIAMAMSPMRTSGTVDFKKVFDWLISKGWIRSIEPVNAFEYGIEIAETNGVTETFGVTNFTATAN